MIDYGLLKSFKNNTAITVPNGNSYSYGDLSSYVKEVGEFLEPRSLIISMTNNDLGSVIGYLSSLLNDTIILLINKDLNQKLLNKLINVYQPEYIWCSSVNCILFPASEKLIDLFGYSLLKLKSKSSPVQNNELALLLPTSGSTGSPKLVKITNKNIYSNAKSISKYLSIDSNERPITSLPLFYSFGLSILNSHLIKGSEILLTSKSLLEKDFWTFFNKYKCTSLSGVPYSFEILKKIRFLNMELPYLKTLTQAGGKLNDRLIKDFAKYCTGSKRRFFIMYGQTEATARISYLPNEQLLNKIGSIGIPIPGGSLFLTDEGGNVINENNMIGELAYKGNNVSMGYAKTRSDLNNKDQNNGFLLTGDLALRDNDNYYYIVGRKKRFIKIFGKRVNLDELESLIKDIEIDCACVGEDDNLIVYIIDKKKFQEVKKLILDQVNIHPRAFRIKKISKIPKTPSGKIFYSKLIQK